MLDNVQLSQPGVVKRITGGMNDVTQPVLFGKREHGVQEALHSFHRLDE